MKIPNWRPILGDHRIYVGATATVGASSTVADETPFQEFHVEPGKENISHLQMQQSHMSGLLLRSLRIKLP